MRILLVGNYEYDSQESMQRFAAALAQGLAEAGHEVETIKPRARFGRLVPSDRGIGKYLGYVDKFFVFPFELRAAARRADVVHICDQGNAFYTRHLQSVPHVVTCHDVLAIRSALGEIPQNRTGRTGQQLQRMILRGLIRAQQVACVSEATARDLRCIAGISAKRVCRIYNSLNYPFSSMDRDEAVIRLRGMGLDAERPFILHVGGNQWYKNRLGVLEIFAHFRELAGDSPNRDSPSRDSPNNDGFHLVMAGKPWTDEMRSFAAAHDLSRVVHELTSVPGEDLRALYSSATMMFFPSLQEGFGWPILEAQACGCPVVTSGRAPMTEIGGAAAIYIDPEQPELAAVKALEALSRLPELRQASLAHAGQFSAGMIQNYLSLYEETRADRSLAARNKVGRQLPETV